ncbi:MAG: 3-hydroxyacyl-CoA dehydrogenase NAD-binding domain-containing protein [Shinella sp.]|uniref:3-hydroxyacyl-CoA dehydrogenase NAD-binding domain-containing protein n=1 Tax=Shinella sp. TaxID=1870904 RepID=UPI003C768B77
MVALKVSKSGGLVVVMLDDPPVNALGHAVRTSLRDIFQEAEADKETIAIVLGAEGKVFCAGADITEFNKPPLAPVLSELLASMDEFTKPVVAAIGGAALGGGLELVLACDARIATPKASFGLPEVKLGLLPGAGGTQRLPRLAGAVAALEMITDGDLRPAQTALEMGFIDQIVPDEDLLAAATAMAISLVKTGRRRVSTGRMDAAQWPAFEEAAKAILGKQPDATEMTAIVESIRNSFNLDFAAGCRAEQALFQELRQGERSEALRYAFFAERQSARVEGVPSRPESPVERVTVIGGGTMGAGIAMAFANAAIPATIIETDEAAAARAIERIGGIYDMSVRRGSLSVEGKATRLSCIVAQVGLDRASEADLIVEAAFEDMEVKRAIFSKLGETTRDGVTLATNTSYLDVDQIAAFSGRSKDVLGMHFFSPANVMKLVEIVRARDTDPQALARIVDVVKRLGKIPVVVGVCHGFVGNRMMARRSEQVDRMLLEGATPVQIDAVLTAFGFRMGPCAMSDLAGLDISWRMRKATGRKAPIADALCEAGRFGQKTAGGYYAYPEGSRTGVTDAGVIELMEQVSAREGVTRRALDDREVLERLIYPMIDEGARILHEGIAARSSDIDVIWLHGYNWPRGRGGPMFYAKQVGPKIVAQQLEAYSAAIGNASLRPFEGLVELLR